jgi:hypothetical protein
MTFILISCYYLLDFSIKIDYPLCQSEMTDQLSYGSQCSSMDEMVQLKAEIANLKNLALNLALRCDQKDEEIKDLNDKINQQRISQSDSKMEHDTLDNDQAGKYLTETMTEFDKFIEMSETSDPHTLISLMTGLAKRKI